MTMTKLRAALITPLLLVLLAALMGPLVLADDQGPAMVSVGEAGAYESVLLDARGLALYLFTSDADGVSTCYDQCAENWPPVLGTGLQGSGIDAALVGTTQRRDATTQVTYGGWPLYRFAADTPGSASGQGLNDSWFLVSAVGEAIEPAEDATGEAEAEVEAEETQEEAEETPEAAEPTFDELFALGETLFAGNCFACHGANGQGGAGPALDGNGNLRSALGILGPILWGFPPNMPAFGGQYSDEEVAAIATYVRNAWSNDFGGVTPGEVSNRR